jgi:hypothetical protein
MGADPTGDPGERVFLSHEGQGLFKLAGCNEGNVTLGVHVDRAGSPAGRLSSLLNPISTRHGLSKELIDGRAVDKAFFIIVGDLHRTGLYAVGASLTFLKGDVTGFLMNRNFKMSRASLHLLHSSIGQNLDVAVATRIDQFRRHDTHGAIIGGESFVELGHGPANTDVLFEEVDFKARFSEIEGGLDSTDPSSDDQNGTYRGVGSSDHISLPSW